MAGSFLSACGSTVRLESSGGATSARTGLDAASTSTSSVGDISADAGMPGAGVTTAPVTGLGSLPSVAALSTLGAPTSAVPGAGGVVRPGARVTSGPSKATKPGTATAKLDPAGAPGVTDTTITVGIEILDTGGYNAAFGAAGIKGATVSDFRTMYNTVIDYANAHGAVFGGRKLVPLFHTDKATDPDANTTYQSLCADFTEDHKVWAGQAYLGWGDEQVVECLSKAGSLAIGQYNLTGPQSLYEKYNDYAFAPISMEAVAGARNQIIAAKQQGFLDGTHALGGPHRVGIMYYSDNMLKAGYTLGYVPTLAQYGFKVTDFAEIDPNNDSPGIQGAVLKFQQDGVDRIFVLGTSTGMSQFMTLAEGQQYHPRYSINSTNNPNLLSSNAPPSQLQGSVGIGWLPATDFKLPDWPANPARDLCLKIHADAGNVAASELDRAIQMAICSQIFFTQLILNTTRSLKPSEVRKAVEAIGTTHVTTADGVIDVFGPHKHWGTGYFFWMSYDSSCVCFKPQGEPRPVQ
jgi:hypothetical protein